MTEQERKSYLGFGLILVGIGIGYLVLGIPLPRMEMVVWGLILAVMAVGYLRPAFQQWHPQLQVIYKAYLLFALVAAALYFIIRIFAPAWVAAAAAIGLLLYFGRMGVIEGILILNERYDDAHRYVDTLLRIFPGNTRLRANKANIYLAQKQYEEARSIATQTIDFIKTRQGKKPVNTSRKTLNGTPLISAYNARLTASIQLRDGATALPDAEVLVRLLPLDPTGYVHRGTALLYTGDYESAVPDFEHALTMSLTPFQRGVTENNFGLLCFAMKDYPAALEHYIKVTRLTYTPLERQEILPLVYVNMANVHIAQGNMQAAWHAVHTAAESNPKSPYVRAGIATLHALESNWDAAVPIWKDLAAEDPHFKDRAYVKDRYYRWTPHLASLADAMINRLEA